ncbi:hypothetical protein TeGR_g8715, partial [Tetraparma gracilis]
PPATLASLNVPADPSGNLSRLSSLTSSSPLLSLLEISPSTGPTPSQLSASLSSHGGNALPSAPPASFASLLVDSIVDDGTVQILIAAALVSLLIGTYSDPATGWIEGAAILSAVAIVALVTAGNDWSKERQFRALDAARADAPDVKVLRGRVTLVRAADVRVGDLVSLEPGDKAPADCVLVGAGGGGLAVDESSLTGEPDAVEKGVGKGEDRFVLSGCNVQRGSGTAVCIAVGPRSQWGAIKLALRSEPANTPLQDKLDVMAAMIGNVGIAAAALTFAALMWIRYKSGSSEPWFQAVLDAFIIAVTIVVVAVPEGLPLAVTISLAFSTKRMLADNNLIRHLQACETMGNATTICSDKTGTLTENKMTVVDSFFGFGKGGGAAADVVFK